MNSKKPISTRVRQKLQKVLEVCENQQRLDEMIEDIDKQLLELDKYHKFAESDYKNNPLFLILQKHRIILEKMKLVLVNIQTELFRIEINKNLENKE